MKKALVLAMGIALTAACGAWGAEAATIQSTSTQEAAAVNSTTAPTEKAAESKLPERSEAVNSAWLPGLEAGLEIYHTKYTEPNVMKNSGMMYGVTGAYTWRCKPIVPRFEARLAFGEVDYTSHIAGTLDGIPDTAFETRGLLGHDFPVKTTTLTPYAGLAYRYLRDDSSGKVTSKSFYGYNREANYIYSPIGVATATPMGRGWTFGATAEYDLFWFGKQFSHLSDVSPSLPDVTNDQNDGFGWRGSLRFVKQFRRNSLVIEPFVRYWHIFTSEVSFGGIEPDNQTVEAGIDVGVTF